VTYSFYYGIENKGPQSGNGPSAKGEAIEGVDFFNDKPRNRATQTEFASLQDIRNHCALGNVRIGLPVMNIFEYKNKLIRNVDRLQKVRLPKLMKYRLNIKGKQD
jgi:hypothetical protein